MMGGGGTGTQEGVTYPSSRAWMEPTLDTDVHLRTKHALLLVHQCPPLTALTILTKSIQNNAFYVSKSGL